ncbi:MAG: glutathione S-transferase family protein [Caldimonas sp.]
MQLYVGNKNYSSWSLRAWLLMKALGIAFTEQPLRLDSTEDSPFKKALLAIAPTGRVPLLVDNGFAVWDSFAIAEYLAERFPDKGVWPADRLQRARARSLCAEMHSGFAALRERCPMNIEVSMPEIGVRAALEWPDLIADVRRIDEMWSGQLAASGGPFLFGAFGAVDAFYAPVCSRFATYGLSVGTSSRAYVERMLALPSMREWSEAGRAEHDFLPVDEPYRKPERH